MDDPYSYDVINYVLFTDRPLASHSYSHGAWSWCSVYSVMSKRNYDVILCYYYVIIMTHTFKHSWYMTLPYHVSPIIYSLNPKYLLTHTSRASSRIMTHYQWLIFMSHKYESSFTPQKKPQMFQNIYGSYITTFPYSSSYSHVTVIWPFNMTNHVTSSQRHNDAYDDSFAW